MAYFCVACELKMILTFLKGCKSKTKCNKNKQTYKEIFFKKKSVQQRSYIALEA